LGAGGSFMTRSKKRLAIVMAVTPCRFCPPSLMADAGRARRQR